MKINQGTIIDKFKKYVDLEAKRYNTEENKKKGITYPLKNVELLFNKDKEESIINGLCSGFSLLWLFRKSKKQELLFFKNLQLISEWNESETTLNENNRMLGRIFEELFSYLIVLQKIPYFFKDTRQNDFHLVFEVMKESTTTPGIVREFRLSFVLKRDQLIRVLSNVTANEVMITLDMRGHSTAIYFRKNEYLFYDSNSKKGEEKFVTIHGLVDHIMENLFKYEKNTSVDEINMDVDLSVFRYVDQSPSKYKKTSAQLVESFLQQEGKNICLSSDQVQNNSLMLACRDGHLELVNVMLKAPQYIQNINYQNQNGSTALMGAGAFGYKDIVEKLLKIEGIDVNKQHKDGFTVLMYAVLNKYMDVIRMLLKAPGIDVNKQNKDGFTVLMYAVLNKDMDVIRMLLKAPGIDVNKQNKDGFTVLMYAVLNKDMDIIRMLLKAPGIDVNKQNKDGFTALMYAVLNKDMDVIRMLLKAPGIDVNKQNKDGFTVLMYAVDNKYIDVIKMLLMVPGIDVNKQNKDGFTVLMYAVLNKDMDVIKMLLMVPGIDVNKKTKNGTALSFAEIDEEIRKLIKMAPHLKFIAPSFLSFTEKDDLFLVLQKSNFFKFQDIVTKLGHKFDVHKKNNDQQTLLHLASINKNATFVEFLLNLGADPNVPDKDGKSPIYYAVERGNIEHIKFYQKNIKVDWSAMTNSQETIDDILKQGKQKFPTGKHTEVKLVLAKEYSKLKQKPTV